MRKGVITCNLVCGQKRPIDACAALVEMGSLPPLAADLMKVRCRPDDADSLHNIP